MSTGKTKLHVEIAVGESFTIGTTVVTLQQKSGQRARLLVQASADTTVTRPGRNTLTNPSAQECAPSPNPAKEHTHGQHHIS